MTARAGRLGAAACWRTVSLVAIVLLMLCIGTKEAQALDPTRRMDQFHHRVFLPRGNMTTEVRALAQTDDGYIWVGTHAGLYRFDGATFDLMSSLGGQDIANRPVFQLLAEPGGGLWIGYSGGAGSGHFQGGHYTAYSAEQGRSGMGPGAVEADGVVWLPLDGRLVRIDHQQVAEIGRDWGIPDVPIRDAGIDSSGTVWVSTAGEQDLFYLPHGERRFRWIGRTLGATLLCVAPDGVVVVSGLSGLWAIGTSDGLPTTIVHVSMHEFSRSWVDRDGGLFASVFTKVYHLGSAKRLLDAGGEAALMADSFMPRQGDEGSPAVVNAIMEDREGNLWVASGAALERFRTTRFTPVSLPGASFTFGVVAGDGGAVWAANWNSRLMRVDDRAKVTVLGNVGTHISSLYRDRSGAIWVGGADGIWRSDSRGQFERISVPGQLLRPWVTNMTLDAADRLWVQGASLMRGSPDTGEWLDMSHQPGFDAHARALAMMTDAAGRVWMGRGNTIVRVENGVPRTLSELSSALHVGAILTFAQRGDRIWIGGLQGIAVVRGDRVLNLTIRDGTPFSEVTGIIESPDGELWARGADDAWRVPADEVRGALRDNRGDVVAAHYDALDGVDSAAVSAKSAMALASDGRLWIGTRRGLVWIDTHRQDPAAPIPVRHIKSVTMDGKAMDSDAAVTLAPLTHRLEITYTAIDLGYPERIQFRYKLEGFDRDWQLAGTRRVAYYNDLPPGDYVFHVSSTDRDGRWRDLGEATLALHAEPAWFQTLVFKLGCILLALLLASLAYRTRMNRVARTLRLELEQHLAQRYRIANARQAERNRIARELHDTLLQGVYGVVWRFQTLINRMPESDALRGSMTDALERADRMLAEGRRRVHDLRTLGGVGGVLVEQLEQIVDEIGTMPAITFAPSCEGRDIELAPRVRAEILVLAAEALRNAYRHSNGTQVEMRLRYGDDAFQLQVANDGRVIPQETLDHGRPGHWGLAGMRERARAIGATLSISEREGGGVVVALSLPARLAYARHSAGAAPHDDLLPGSMG